MRDTFRPIEIDRNQFNKPLPASIDSEKAVCGGVILDNDLMAQAVELLSLDDFYSPLHRRVFKAMLTLFKASQTIDPILIGEEMKKDGSIDSIGGVSTIANLTFGLPHFTDITNYCRIIKDKSIVRQTVKLCNLLTDQALAEESTAEELLNYGESEFYQIRDKNFTSKQSNDSYTDLLKASLTEMQRRAQSDKKIFGIQTGLTDLDRMTGGIQKEYIILAGRPSMGKSACGFDIARQACLINRDLVIPIFSLEMGKEQVVNRHIAQTALVDATRMKDGGLVRSEWGKVAQAVTELSDLNMPIDDTAKVTPNYIRARCRRWKKEFGRLDGIIIDYGGLITPDVDRGSTYENVNAISKELVAIKKEFNMFVLRLEQLNRDCEKRPDRRPRASDLRDSGNLEQDADSVWLLYREEYYHKTDANAGKAELIIGKTREGHVGTVPLAFLNFCTHFANYYDG
jgi:replicative DNA helicase